MYFIFFLKLNLFYTTNLIYLTNNTYNANNFKNDYQAVLRTLKSFEFFVSCKKSQKCKDLPTTYMK